MILKTPVELWNEIDIGIMPCGVYSGDWDDFYASDRKMLAAMGKELLSASSVRYEIHPGPKSTKALALFFAHVAESEEELETESRWRVERES